ncbi:helix-turn-helix domain-containing protein [Maribacter stanieri]|uniref:helix-turn-helix domain-containing protein n=1 Tax=Maribacter stanieri TaxID=440514 RepID=UPI002493F844|nr:helix-turn-helix domain-containing protein [Maribacter stanieri]|tara:strand:- start:1141 stop:2829 length:1689 start_codon:yes stop_codon:yes gene_type:complete
MSLQNLRWYKSIIILLLIFIGSIEKIHAQEDLEGISDSLITEIREIYKESYDTSEQTLSGINKIFKNIDTYNIKEQVTIYLVLIDFQMSGGLYDEAIKNCHIAHNMANENGFAYESVLSNFYLARALKFNYNYDNSFKLFKSLAQLIDDGDYEYLAILSELEMADLYELIGKYREALDIRLNIYFNKGEKLKNRSKFWYIAQPIYMANLYNRLGVIDSTYFYRDLYENTIEEYSENSIERILLINNEANISFANEDYSNAVNKYRNYINFSFKRFKGYDSPVLIKKSKAHLALGEVDSALSNLNLIKSMPSFVKEQKYISPDFYKLYIDIYKKKGEDDLRKEYEQKYYKALETYNSFKFNTLDNLYDIDKQRILIESSNDTKGYKSKVGYLWSAIIAIVILSIAVFLWKQKTEKKKFEALMLRTENKTPLSNSLDHSINTNEIKDEKIEALISQIKELQEQGFFLKQKTTLYNTAKKLKTNTSYLSNVINNNLKTTFSAFVNDIRIDYIINELKTNKQIRSYSVKAIAEEIGYKSADSFSKYFKQSTGLSPSAFIKNINKEG